MMWVIRNGGFDLSRLNRPTFSLLADFPAIEIPAGYALRSLANDYVAFIFEAIFSVFVVRLYAALNRSGTALKIISPCSVLLRR
jgi:hypothetical protein